MILVADIGGTHTRFSVAKRAGSHWSLEHVTVKDTGGDLPSLVREYVAGLPAGQRPDVFACCGAGPRQADGTLKLTNASVVLDPKPLRAAAGVRRVLILNDFEAVAHALPAFGPGDLRQLGGAPAAADATKVAVGPGTGLGVAILLRHMARWVAVPGEGGHIDLGPVSDDEFEVARALTRERGRLEAEAVLCGPGLERLYAVLSQGRHLPAAEIDRAARAKDPLACRAIEVFTRWLGRFAGDMALTSGARGGVYLAGGILPTWRDLFDAELFRAGFEDKGHFRGWLQPVPVYLITHPQPGLIGLASYAGQQRVRARR